MQKSKISHAINRALGIIRANPSKLVKVLTPSGWIHFFDLTKERIKSSEEVARIESRQQAQREEFQGEAWNHDNGGISRRRYGSYEEYVVHQAEKLDSIGGEAFVSPQKAIKMFQSRLELVTELPQHSKVLCLGARRGEEVQAFIRLGHDAIGIDLNPGQNNEFVIQGDFHSLDFNDGSVGCVYVNCLDHAFDLGKILNEVCRVLKTHGLFIADIPYGYDEGFVMGNHDAMHWRKAREFAEYLAKVSEFRIVTFRDLAQHGSKYWTQCVMRKV